MGISSAPRRTATFPDHTMLGRAQARQQVSASEPSITDPDEVPSCPQLGTDPHSRLVKPAPPTQPRVSSQSRQAVCVPSHQRPSCSAWTVFGGSKKALCTSTFSGFPRAPAGPLPRSSRLSASQQSPRTPTGTFDQRHPVGRARLLGWTTRQAPERPECLGPEEIKVEADADKYGGKYSDAASRRLFIQRIGQAANEEFNYALYNQHGGEADHHEDRNSDPPGHPQ